jgi:hypothetical protein
MSNIYNRRLDYQVTPTGKPFLQQQKTTVYPEYAVVGNIKPNLDYKTNRMLQPLFQTKKPIPQGPFNPKQPINANGLGGRVPFYINYVSQPLASFKSRPPKGLLWEPNSIRETRLNVYPDGVPKNFSQLQQADSQYLENLNNEKKQKQLEERYEQLSKSGGHDGSRPHKTASVEEELKRLDEMLAETKYGKGPYKNIGLTAEQHRKMAEKQAQDIRKELEDLRKEALVHKTDVVDAIKSSGPEEIKLPEMDDPKALNQFLTDYEKMNRDLPGKDNPDSEKVRKAYILGFLLESDPSLDIKDKKVQDQVQKLVEDLKFDKRTTLNSYKNKIKKVLSKSPSPPDYDSLTPAILKRSSSGLSIKSTP